ncbi:Copine-8, partial [Spheniscus mendiculus]
MFGLEKPAGQQKPGRSGGVPNMASVGDFNVLSSSIPATKVELSVSCRNLLDRDTFSKSDPICVLYTQAIGNKEWREFGRTEVIDNTLNPDFVRKFIMDYFFEERENLRFDFYDVDSKSPNLSKHDFLGQMFCTLGEIVGSQGSRLEKSIVGIPGKKCGTVIVTAEELGCCRDSVLMQFCANKLDKKDFFGKSDPFLVFHRSNEDGSFTICHKTEVIKNTLNPVWQAFKIPVRALCNGDYDRPVQRDLEHFQRWGIHSFSGKPVPVSHHPRGKKFLPYVQSKSALLKFKAIPPCPVTTGPTKKFVPIFLILKGHNKVSSEPSVLQAEQSLRSEPFFVREKEDGGIYMEFLVLNSRGAICYYSSLLSVLCTFFLKKLAFQIAFILTNKIELFFLSDWIDTSSFKNVRACILILWLETVLINHGTRTCMQYKNMLISIIFKLVCLNYVLLILTYILNIWICTYIWIFKTMEELDGDVVRISSRGKFAERDIVQFVPFRDYIDRSGNHVLSMARLAKDVLAEIPEQFLSYMRVRGIKPSPAPPPYTPPIHVLQTQI